MANARRILRNLSLSLDGHPISTGANKFEIKIGRDRLPFESLEDVGKFSEKGDWMASASAEGFGLEAEQKLLAQLADDEEDSTSLLLFLESNTRLSPHANPGSAALFMICRTFGVPSSDTERGKIKRWAAEFENSDGARPWIGQVIHTNRARTPNPAGGGDVITPTPITLLALDEGEDGLPGTIGVFTVHCNKLQGTGTVTLLCELLSDTPGFASPLVRATFPLFTNEDPVPGGQQAGPSSQTIILYGDSTPLPGETQWTIRFTVTDTDTDGQVEWMAAGVIAQQ